MNGSRVSTVSAEQQLLSKKAINLPPRERFDLLLKANKYPIVHKRTSTEAQVKEMLDFYNICSLMLAKYFPNEQSIDNFVILSLVYSKKDDQTIITKKLAKAFKLLDSYEKLERKITAIQALFFQYREAFPYIYELYNLEDFATEQISDIIENSKLLLDENPEFVKSLIERWELS